MIIVTGASGQLGRAVIEQLLERVPATAIGASVRDPAKVADLAARGVRVRKADFEDRTALAHAFEGASRVLLVSSDAQRYGADPIAQHAAAIATARAAGARRIFYTSHLAASPTSAFGPMHTHAKTEAMLAESGVPFTALRNGFYATTALEMVQQAGATGKLVAPADGKVSWTSHADLAAATAVVLADPADPADGPIRLTGGEALDLAEIASLASLERVVVSDEEHRARLRSFGLPERVQDIVIGMFVASRNGEFAAIDPTLERLVGRKPVSVRDLLASKK